MSVPVCCTESLAIQPTPSTVSANVMLAGEEAPEYTRIDFLPKITKKLLCVARATTSSLPVGHTVVRLRLPVAPPVHFVPSRVSLQYTVCLLPTMSVTHSLPKAASTSLPCGTVPEYPV